MPRPTFVHHPFTPIGAPTRVIAAPALSATLAGLVLVASLAAATLTWTPAHTAAATARVAR